MIRVPLCSSCWRRLSPVLSRAAIDEGAFLISVADELERCGECRTHAPALRRVGAEQSPLGQVIETVWDWVSGVEQPPPRARRHVRRRARRR